MKKRGAFFYLAHSTIHLIFSVFCIAIILPLLLIIAISFTDEKDIFKYGYQLIPRHFSIEAYNIVLAVPKTVLNAYAVSIFITVTGTVFGLLFISMAGYCISRRDFRYRRILTVYIVITMLFSGGLVGYFIIMTNYLHLTDSLLALILPGMVGGFNIFLMKGYMSDIHPSIIESAKIDGARELKIFFRIIVPLSKPAFAAIGLLMSFNYWNEWFNAMLFINKDNMIPIQLLLVRMLNNIELLTSDPEFARLMQMLNAEFVDIPKFTTRMATVILVVGPMLIVFPFFQRYFIKGLAVGSIKE